MRGHIFLLKKAMGCSCCKSTTPIAIPEASVSTVNSEEKSEIANTEAEVIAVLRVVKVAAAYGVQVKEVEHNKSVRGTAMDANPRMKRR